MGRGPYYDQGKYWVKICGQALGQSKNKGTPEFALQFTVLGKVNPNDPDGDLLGCGECYERTTRLYITDKTIDRVASNLEKLGYDKDSFKFLDPKVSGGVSFTGKELAMECKHEDYQGDLKEKWEFPFESTPLENTPMESAAIRNLDTLFGSQLKKLKRAKPPEEPKAPVKREKEKYPDTNAQPVGAATDDDIPF